MRHGTATVITRIHPDALEALDRSLEEASRLRTALFSGVPGLHFARWAIIDLTDPGSTRAGKDLRLLFGADFNVPEGDGDSRQLDRRFVHDFVSWLWELRAQGAHAATVFDDLYRACHDYPEQGLGDTDAVEAYLLRHRMDADSRHVDFVYRFESPEELRESVDVLREVNRHLDARARLLADTPWRGGRGELPHLHRELRDVALSVSSTVFDAGWTARLARARRAAALATLVYPLHRYLRSLPVVQGLKLKLSLLDAKHPAKPWSPCAPELSAIRGPPALHDAMVQNPMVHVARVTGGPLAAMLAAISLRSVNRRLSRYVVGMNHIQTIHCARWLLHSDGDGGPRHLIFLSNYDDSWEAYIDAFVDHTDVRSFLELIWSRTEGFPRKTRRWGGWEQRLPVEPFKAWLRGHEVPTRVWYSAALHGGPHQRHSVLLLHNALRLRELLARERIDRPLRDWAARRAFTAFLSRGACHPGPALLPLPALLIHSLSALSIALRGMWAALRRKPRVLEPTGLRPHLSPEQQAVAWAFTRAGPVRRAGAAAARLPGDE